MISVQGICANLFSLHFHISITTNGNSFISIYLSGKIYVNTNIMEEKNVKHIQSQKL